MSFCVPGVPNYHLMKCKYCGSECMKKGKYKSKQKYQCKSCLKYQLSDYTYLSYLLSDSKLIELVKEGCGIRSISRLLRISPTTVIARVLKIGKRLCRKTSLSFGRTYQVDELFTYLKNKNNRVCVAYSIDHQTGDVIDIMVGRRNKTNLRKVISTLILAEAKKIITDRLNIYKKLIPVGIHSTKFRGINKIERKNLDLRTHLKRLNRKTICYSKSLVMLLAVVRIYFWG